MLGINYSAAFADNNNLKYMSVFSHDHIDDEYTRKIEKHIYSDCPNK
jgi:hypothetical protein